MGNSFSSATNCRRRRRSRRVPSRRRVAGVLKKAMKAMKKVTLRMVVFPDLKYRSGDRSYLVGKGQEEDEQNNRQAEESRAKIDGLSGPDLIDFHGLGRKEIIRFLERSLSEKERTLYGQGIKRIEKIRSGKSNAGRTNRCPDMYMHCVTWNMNGKMACHELPKLLGGKGETFDFYVVGLQEVPACDPASVILEALGTNYSLIASSIMVSLQLFIFARNAAKQHIKDVKMDKVGVGSLVGAVRRRQKGAVAITFKYRGFSLLFIACHLSAHENNVLERNVQYQRICQSLFSKSAKSSSWSSSSSLFLQSPNRLMQDLSKCKLLNNDVEEHCRHIQGSCFPKSDVVVWLGDLNYRIEGSRKSVSLLINQDLHKLLRAKDQLSREAERGHIFHGFCEGPLAFRPTYKYDIGSDDYDTSAKERVPSWTDRILYKVNTKAANLLKAHVHDYDSIDTVRSSDHRPVKALLTLQLGSLNATTNTQSV